MFAAGSIKSSKWGWDFKGYAVKYGANYNGGTVGPWGLLTLAPNGFYYALPRVWLKADGSAANEVLCFKPGRSNNRTGKWEPAQIFLIPGSGGKRPPLPSSYPSALASAQNRFPSKGVLAHNYIENDFNGCIYFFGWGERSYVRLRPQLDPDADPMTATEWDVIAYNSTSPQINPSTGSQAETTYSGGILGRDGHIYVIPSPYSAQNASSKQRVVRIKPRNTSINTGNVDIIELGYSNGTTGFFNSTGAVKPYLGVDSSGVTLSTPSDMSFGYSTSPGGSISNALVHPNGKIYLFGGASKRLYILDPTKWGTSSEIYTSNTLYFPNILTSNPDYGWFGSSFYATLEKLNPEQDPETLKIYFGYGGKFASNTNSGDDKLYTATIEFDPVTETFTSELYDAVTNEGLAMMPSTTGTATQSNSTAFINMPNGHIFQSQQSYGSAADGSRNLFGKLLYKAYDGLYKYIGPQKRNILNYTTENKVLFDTYSAISGSEGFSSATPGIKSSLGKTIYSSIYGACEITSVKGFYPGIKNFDYTPDTDADIYDIPSDISNLPTSLWNAYFNKPR
jgi:hypothetical protein